MEVSNWLESRKAEKQKNQILCKRVTSKEMVWRLLSKRATNSTLEYMGIGGISQHGICFQSMAGSSYRNADGLPQRLKFYYLVRY